MVIKRYASRVLLLILLLLFLGCDEADCESPSYCGGYGMEIKEATLSPSNPTLRVTTGVGALECGAGCQVLYDWADEDYKDTAAAKKNRPPISVKFGTQEKGLNVRGESEDVPTGPSRFNWEMGAHVPMGADTDKKVTVTKVHFVALVTLNQPLVKLPAKSPTIRLPFIGTTLLGPSPAPVNVNVSINYYKPLPQK